jgi:iron-sulfur cluster repair protein YtfE (RIC family)
VAKRHQSLISLSHDHHHGLALALRLQQGDKALLADGWTHDRDQQADRVLRFFEDELSVHFRLEEEVLFPAIVKLVPGSAPLVDTLIAQHREVEALIGRLQTPRDASLQVILVDLGTLLESHIRVEERRLFPEFERLVPEPEALRIGESLRLMGESYASSRNQRRDR